MGISEIDPEKEDTKGKTDKAVDFINEKIKLQPLNRKRLLQNMAIAILLAIMFGVIASLSYRISEKLAETPFFQSKSDESAIEDALSEEDEYLEDDGQSQAEAAVQGRGGNITVPKAVADYEQVYSELYAIAKAAGKAIVPVSAISADMDWFSNEYENSNSGSGLVIANDNKELLILIDYSYVNTASDIYVKFPDGSSSEASIKKSDPNTRLAILAVPVSEMTADALAGVEMAKFGSSMGDTLLGKNVIAIGSPQGTSNSVCYGTVTATSQLQQLQDTDVHLISTDMYGSLNGSGILINLKGQVVGIITHDFAKEDMENVIMAYSISDIKTSVLRMAKGEDKAFFGIYGCDVSDIAKKEHKVPEGAYVTDIVMNSPAMIGGIQKGDVITKIGVTPVRNFDDFKKLIDEGQPGVDTVVTVARYARGGYREVTLEVDLGILN